MCTIPVVDYGSISEVHYTEGFSKSVEIKEIADKRLQLECTSLCHVNGRSGRNRHCQRIC